MQASGTKTDVQAIVCGLRGVRYELRELSAYIESAINRQTRLVAGILIVQTGVQTALIVDLLKLLEV